MESRMWGVKTETIPVIVGAALGAMPQPLKGNCTKELELESPISTKANTTTDIRTFFPGRNLE